MRSVERHWDCGCEWRRDCTVAHSAWCTDLTTLVVSVSSAAAQMKCMTVQCTSVCRFRYGAQWRTLGLGVSGGVTALLLILLVAATPHCANNPTDPKNPTVPSTPQSPLCQQPHKPHCANNPTNPTDPTNPTVPTTRLCTDAKHDNAAHFCLQV